MFDADSKRFMFILPDTETLNFHLALLIKCYYINRTNQVFTDEFCLFIIALLYPLEPYAKVKKEDTIKIK